MDDVIDIFVGTDRSQALAVPVLEYSIRRHTEAPVRITSMLDLPLPEPKDVRQGSRTNFSFARFAIPELKGHQGKAIYLDADMQVVRDIRGLWNTPFAGATVVIQEQLPIHAVIHDKPGAPPRRRMQCSVMLIDCEKAGWDVHEIVAGLDGRYTYEELMYELCILDEDEVRHGLPFEWNSLEYFDESTCLIHYTDMNTQPWVSPENRLGPVWLSEVLRMLEEGVLSRGQIQTEIDLGYFRPSLLLELEEMPHADGFDEEACARYADMDRRAGFKKHAEVYARKRARAAAAARAA